MKLGLGTVQFGVDYGISNSVGRTPPEQVGPILDLAASLGVAVIDTASLYGSSEAVLGQALRPGHAFRLVTKTGKFPAATITEGDANALVSTFRRSLELLRVNSVHGLMAHDADDLLKPGGERLVGAMQRLKSEGLTARIGASVYTGAQIESLRNRYGLDLLQAPVNILDQRLLAGGHLKALKAAGWEVHARSAFLQGALVMEPSSLPAHFQSVRVHLQRLRDHLREAGITPVQAALGFVAGRDEIDTVVCGINDRSQLAELGPLAVPLAADLSGFAIADESILNPSRWSR